MAEVEAMLLAHYNLPTLNPTEWPAGKDDSDASEEDEASAAARKKSKYKSRRYTTLERGHGAQNPVGRQKSAGTALVQTDEKDPLGGRQTVLQSLRFYGSSAVDDLQLRNQFLLSSTTFSPTLYLAEVQQDSSTEDLLRGLDFLSRSIDEKSASLKTLVESNFERFVRAKAVIDNLYNEMRNHGAEAEPAAAAGWKRHSRHQSRQSNHARKTSGPISPTSRQMLNEKKKNALLKESEYGTQGLKILVGEATTKAEEIWGPALGGRDREENLRGIHEALEKNRPIIEGYGIIEDCVKRHDYETLAEGYMKAQKLARETKMMADRAKQQQVKISNAQVHQIIIVSRVWTDIEDRMREFREDVWKKLLSANTKGDDYMELIGVLLRIGCDENPIVAWVRSQGEHLRNKIIGHFERSRVELEIARRRLGNSQRPDPRRLAHYLRAASSKSEVQKDSQHVVQFWDQVCTALSSLVSTSGVLGELMEYLETVLAFIDGRKQKSLPIGIDGRSRHHLQFGDTEKSELRVGAVTLFKLIRDQLHALFVEPPVDDVSALFTPLPTTPKTPKTPLSFETRFALDDVPPPSPRTGEPWEGYAFWPPTSNSLSGASYLSRIVAMIATAVAEIAALTEVRRETQLMQQLKNLVSDVRERSITVVCAVWLDDSANCSELEDWVRMSDRRDVTHLPTYFSAFESSILSYLQKIAYVPESVSEAVSPPSSRHIETIQRAFKNSLDKAFGVMMDNTARPISVSTDILGKESMNTRKLLAMSNFRMLRTEIVPTLCSQFESQFSLTISDDTKTARNVLQQMHSQVFKSYVAPCDQKLHALVVEGVASQLLPSTSKEWRPTDARPYIYDILLVLVLVHTETTSVTPDLTAQVITYYHESVSTHLAQTFKTTPPPPFKYDLPALMQATLDVEFLAQTLGGYTSNKAAEAQGQVYTVLDGRTDNEARTRLQAELPEMRRVLSRLRKSTKGEFGCLKRDKTSKDKGTKPSS